MDLTTLIIVVTQLVLHTFYIYYTRFSYFSNLNYKLKKSTYKWNEGKDDDDDDDKNQKTDKKLEHNKKNNNQKSIFNTRADIWSPKTVWIVTAVEGDSFFLKKEDFKIADAFSGMTGSAFLLSAGSTGRLLDDIEQF